MANNKTLSERIVDSAGTGRADPAELSIVLELTASVEDLNKLDGSGDVVASGTPVANIEDPTGGSTEDAEARAAIEAILDALEAFGIVLPATP